MQQGVTPRFRLLLAGLATLLLQGFVQALLGAALPEMSRLFSLAPGAAARLITAQWIGAAIGVSIMYLWSEHVTPRRALALLVLGGAGMALQLSWPLILLSALIYGSGSGMAAAVYNPRVLQEFGPRGPSMLNLLNAAFAAGAILSPLAFILLDNKSRPAFALIVLGLLAVWLFAKDDQAAVRDKAAEARPGFRMHWPILGFAALGVGLEASLIGLGPTALVASGSSEADAARQLSGFFLLFLLARIGLSLIAHRLSALAIYAAAMAGIALAAMAALALQPGPAFIAMGFCASMFFPSAFTASAQKMGDDPRVTPIFLGAALAGGIGMPVFVSQITLALGPLGFFWLVLAISLPAAVAASVTLAMPKARR